MANPKRNSPDIEFHTDLLDWPHYRALESNMRLIIDELSEAMDLGGLCAITIALDYERAVHSLDRGADNLPLLRVSSQDNDGATGVAITALVLRDGVFKTHIVFDVRYVGALFWINEWNDEVGQALHTLAHECAHVVEHSHIERALPGCFDSPPVDRWRIVREQAIWPSWHEYAACRISAPYGKSPLEGYIHILANFLNGAEAKVHALVMSHATHCDRFLTLESCRAVLSRLLTISAYVLGALDGEGVAVSEKSVLNAALAESWFFPYFLRLHKVLCEVFDRWGDWTSVVEFEPIGDILIDMFEHFGLTLTDNGDNSASLYISWERVFQIGRLF